MFVTKDILGDVIFVSFRDISDFNDLGISNASGHYFVKGLDHIGIWLSHPELYIISSEDKNGKPIPLKDQKKEKLEATFFVAWHQIRTMMHYPDRDGFDFREDMYKNKIGFVKGSDK